MPKLKKAPKNAYYFFMVDRKLELEGRGYRFPGGMKDVASAVRQEWNALRADERAYFENLARAAKEEEKLNFHNKFTATGESFAHVMERQAAEQEQVVNMERIIDDLTVASHSPPENRNFIIIKTIHSCEVLLPRQSFWPLEIAIASFNLKDGMKSNYWTLVNTLGQPTGYASAVKETSEETGLPQPGNKIFEPKHQDYKKILTNIKQFVEKFLTDYEHKYVLFAMDTDLKSAEGCLQWLSDNADFKPEEQAAMNVFLNKLTFYKLSRLLLRFAGIARRRNENYNHVMACYNNLEQSAVSVLNEGCFDYRDDITCDYHNKEEPSIKMHVCCRNMILRRIYLIIKEIVPAMLLPMKDGHDIEMFRKNCTPPAIVPGPPSGISAASYSSSAVRPTPTMANEREESDFLSAAWGKPNAQRPAVSNPYEGGTSSSSPPTFADGPAPAAVYNPPAWGRKKDSQVASFKEEDFPSLGESGVNAVWAAFKDNSGGGREGRGRGGPAPSRGGSSGRP